MNRHKFLLLLVVILIPLGLFSNNKADSLISIVHEYERKNHFESDTNYIKTLIDVANLLKPTNPDSSLFFGDKAYELSARFGYSRGILQSAFAIVPIYSSKYNSQKLLQIGNEIMPVAEKTNRKSLSRVYNILGTAYIIESRTNKNYNSFQVKEMYLKSLEISEEYNDTTAMIRVLTNLSSVYLDFFDYSSALDCLYRAIGLAEKSETQPDVNLTFMFCNISIIYHQQQKWDLALIEAQKALKQAEKDNDMSGISSSMLLIGSTYMYQNKLDEAFEYINKSIEISEQLNFVEKTLESKEFLSILYSSKGLYREALEIAYEVKEAWEKAGMGDRVLGTKTAIAQTHYLLKQYDQGLKICNEILESKTSNMIALSNTHQIMSAIHEDQNQGMKALEHYKQYKMYSDSLFHNNLDEKIIHLEAQNKYEKKEMELKAEQALIETEHIKDKVRLQLIIAFVLALLFSVLGFLIFISKSRRKLKIAYSKLEDANNEIKFQKEEISMQSEELRAINEHLVQLIKFKQDISGMIVHDLKNPLSVMLGLTTSIPDKQSLALLHNSAQRMLNLVLNILDINKYEDSKLELKYSRTDINDLIKLVAEDAETSLNFRKLKINLNLQEDLTFSFDKDIIHRVLDNILNNAIKYSPESETIHISTNQTGSNVRITIRNMGEPIPADMQEAIFEPYGRADRKENESPVKSTGLGLAFCRIAVTAHNGTIGVESASGEPTDFWFELPSI